MFPAIGMRSLVTPHDFFMTFESSRFAPPKEKLLRIPEPFLNLCLIR